jgi:hypothetical protein
MLRADEAIDRWMQCHVAPDEGDIFSRSLPLPVTGTSLHQSGPCPNERATTDMRTTMQGHESSQALPVAVRNNEERPMPGPATAFPTSHFPILELHVGDS